MSLPHRIKNKLAKVDGSGLNNHMLIYSGFRERHLRCVLRRKLSSNKQADWQILWQFNELEPEDAQLLALDEVLIDVEKEEAKLKRH